MTTYTKCDTQRDAIAAARQEVAAYGGVAKVLLMTGDTLRVTEHGESKSAGWDRSGDIYCGPKAYAIAGC